MISTRPEYPKCLHTFLESVSFAVDQLDQALVLLIGYLCADSRHWFLRLGLHRHVAVIIVFVRWNCRQERRPNSGGRR